MAFIQPVFRLIFDCETYVSKTTCLAKEYHMWLLFGSEISTYNHFFTFPNSQVWDICHKKHKSMYIYG